jgi:riboflavin synthase
MFTGLIETTGTLLALTRGEGNTRITIAAPTLAAKLNTGDSVAVNGVCLTDLAAETLARTTLAHLGEGSTVNLELPTPAGSPLGGHVVQGHVDGTARLVSLDPITPDTPNTDWRLRLELPESLVRYVVPQGSITVEGISLTVAALRERIVEIAIIPHTYQATSLHGLLPGSLLNIEVDVLAKYAERRQTESAAEWLTEQYLIANGY